MSQTKVLEVHVTKLVASSILVEVPMDFDLRSILKPQFREQIGLIVDNQQCTPAGHMSDWSEVEDSISITQVKVASSEEVEGNVVDKLHPDNEESP